MRLVALPVLAAFVLAASAGAAPSEYAYDGRLTSIARETLWQAGKDDPRLTRQDVLYGRARCYRTERSFERTFELRSGVAADRVVAYYAGGSDLHLRPRTCANARLFFGGRHTVLTSGAFAIVLHEALHRQGLRDERLTTCFANEAVRWGALKFGFSDEQALRARNLAFTYTRLYAPLSYRMSKPNCLALTRRMEWVELR